MRIEVEVLRAEQSWDLATGVHQNYLVIEVFGIETRVPCTEEDLVRAVQEIGVPQTEFSSETAELDERESVNAPSTFQMPEDLEPTPARLPAAPTRRLAPVSRPREDDVGIRQG